MANNVYKTLGANAQTLTLLATVCLEDPVTQEKAKTLLDKALAQRPDYVKAVVKKAELLSEYHPGVFPVVLTPHAPLLPEAYRCPSRSEPAPGTWIYTCIHTYVFKVYMML